MNIFKFKNILRFTKISFKKILKSPKKLFLLFVLAYNFDNIRLSLSESYTKSCCLNDLRDRFEFSGKFQQEDYKKRLCTIYPTNINDIQKLLEIANFYNVPILNDINENSINKFHFKIDLKSFNKIKELNRKEMTITIEPGVKLTDLLKFLKEKNLTIPILENYEFSEMTINELLFNNYNSFIEGKFIDDIIDEYIVVIPKGEKIIKIKNNNDLQISDLNIKNLFLRSNSTLGILSEVTFKIEKSKNYNFISIDHIQSNIEEVFEILSDLKHAKKALGIKDFYLIKKDDEMKILLKIKQKFLNKCLELLSNTPLIYEDISDSQYYQKLNDIVHNEILLRRLKLIINKTEYLKFFNKLEKYSKKLKVPLLFKTNMNDVEILVKINEDDLENVEKNYEFINNIHKLSKKHKLNIFIDNNLLFLNKYELMRDLGVNNYFIIEEIKYLFDPNYILNPHISVKRPDIWTFKILKRENKIINYILSTIEL